MNTQASTRPAARLGLAAVLAALVGCVLAGVPAGAVGADPQPPGGALGAPELILENGHVHTATTLATAAAAGPATPLAATLATPATGAAARAGLTFPQALTALQSRGELDESLALADRSGWIAARVSYKRLRGTRQAELGAVLANLTQIARDGELTPSRVPELMLTLARNRQWWTTGPMLSPDQRVGFPGSGLVWEYYPGQGIEIQWLGTFGAANGLYDERQYDALGALLDQAVGLAALRGGGIAWEYDFSFDGGSPPWVSAITEGTAVQALSEAGTVLIDAAYLAAAHQALGIFTQPPPTGIRSPTAAGARYLIYSFAPHEYVINAFIQSLVGLFDLASTGDQLAATLFRAGNAQALLDLPSYNTGYWSMYDQYGESDAQLPRAADRVPPESLPANAPDDAEGARDPRPAGSRRDRHDGSDWQDRRDREHRDDRRQRRDGDDRRQPAPAAPRSLARPARRDRPAPADQRARPARPPTPTTSTAPPPRRSRPTSSSRRQITIAHLASTRATQPRTRADHADEDLQRDLRRLLRRPRRLADHAAARPRPPHAELAPAARRQLDRHAQRHRPRRQPRAGRREREDPGAAAQAPQAGSLEPRVQSGACPSGPGS